MRENYESHIHRSLTNQKTQYLRTHRHWISEETQSLRMEGVHTSINLQLGDNRNLDANA